MLAVYLPLILSLFVTAQNPADPVFAQITPSPNISWTSCYNEFTCARLQVPLDYDDPSQGTAAIALIRISAATQPAPTILLNPGGPGGSGVQTILGLAPWLVSTLSTSYNIVGFDPRGVNNTTPAIDCFPEAHDTRTVFRTLYLRDVSDASDTSIANQFTMAQAYGNWCNKVVGGVNGTARFAGSAAVSRDMLAFAEAEQRALGLPEEEAKLWFYGLSYGTVLGATFAAMFPDKIGRMMLDGVMDAEDYYNLQWRSNLVDADRAMETFWTDCFNAGQERCVFWGPSAQDIRRRFEKIVSSLKQNPLPYSDGPDMPRIATYSDLKGFILSSLYSPLDYYPILAVVLRDLENGNGASLAIVTDINLAPGPQDVARFTGDAGSVIPCIDGWGRNLVTSIDAWRQHSEFFRNQSIYVGDVWGHNPYDCATMDVPPPPSAKYSGPIPPTANSTSVPILFLSNVLDPVTPLRSAHRMSSLFPGSVVLAQNGIGHATVANPSNCTAQYMQAYLKDGTLPPVNTTCEPLETRALRFGGAPSCGHWGITAPAPMVASALRAIAKTLYPNRVASLNASNVPLDYDEPDRGTAAVALIKISAATQPAPNILLNPGGPGQSGVGAILTLGPQLVATLGTSYNIIGFDPRGVNNTAPIECFPGSPRNRIVFRSLYFRDASDASDASEASQFALAEAYGNWCNKAIGGANGTARYTGSAAVARDMLRYTEAEQRALGLPETEGKLWYYGLSYGTVLGATFAAMFPDRIGRMMLDGVMDAEDYYNLQWRSNLADADRVVERFFDDCFDAGQERCAFWGNSRDDIKSRFENIIASLRERPIPYTDGSDMPRIITASELRSSILVALYQPVPLFPLLAKVLNQLENGNAALLGSLASVNLDPDPAIESSVRDAGSVIPCVDGWGRGNVTTVEAWREHAAFLRNQSVYVGASFGHNPLDCATMDVPPPPSGSYTGPIPPTASNTSAPLLFLSNELDPVTPVRSAHRMSSLFPGSAVLVQNGIGHATIANPSLCTIQYMQAYLKDGTLPPANTLCEVLERPFFVNSTTGASLMG
ncbi:hypothetical protein ONZ45_g8924 [Pleurotus djamor]|nr:hypothetical protein ONZ45_g8924 [Pleurotus djamor]